MSGFQIGTLFFPEPFHRAPKLWFLEMLETQKLSCFSTNAGAVEMQQIFEYERGCACRVVR